MRLLSKIDSSLNQSQFVISNSNPPVPLAVQSCTHVCGKIETVKSDMKVQHSIFGNVLAMSLPISETSGEVQLNPIMRPVY